MTTDMHVHTSMFAQGEDPDQAPRAILAMLSDLPHFSLGRVVSAHDITICVLFPRLADLQDKFVLLIRDQLSRWLDRSSTLPFTTASKLTTHSISPRISTTLMPTRKPARAKAEDRDGWLSDTTVSWSSSPARISGRGVDGHPAHRPLHTRLADFREPQLFFAAEGTQVTIQDQSFLANIAGCEGALRVLHRESLPHCSTGPERTSMWEP